MGINYINVLVGANNSGKSRFLRELLKKDEYIFINNIFFSSMYDAINVISNLPENSINVKLEINRGYFNPQNFSLNNHELAKIINKHHNGLSGLREYNSSLFESILNCLVSLRRGLETEGKGKNWIGTLKQLQMDLEFLVDISIAGIKDYGGGGVSFAGSGSLINHINELKILNNNILSLINNEITREIINNKIYIPVLRTALRLVNSDSSSSTNVSVAYNDIYRYTVEYYYVLKKEGIDIFTGMDMYEILDKSQRHDEKQIRKNVKAFELFLSQTFFENKKIELIPVTPQDESNINKETQKQIKVDIDGESDRVLYNLGDGVNSIIILMYKIFTAKKDSWIFIEEPEQNLHPAYQRIFIDTLLSNDTIQEKNLKIFFTTHSNHLLDLTMAHPENVSIFTFEKKIEENEERFYINNVNQDDLKILKLLGVNNSSVFISNCSIWVEGITDRKYIKIYLNAYLKAYSELRVYKEDLHYSFLEYAGSNIEHYIFGDKSEFEQAMNENKISSKFLSNRLLLIADKDKGKDIKHFKRVQKISNNFNYLITEGKEIENYISPEILKESLIKFKKTFNEEDFQNVHFKHESYLKKDIGLGKFIDKTFSVNISESSGTLKQHYKDELPEYVGEIVNWDNMGKPAQKFIKEIYKFIEESNQ